MQVVSKSNVKKRTHSSKGKTKYQKILDKVRMLRVGQALLISIPKGEEEEDFRRRVGQAVHYFLNGKGSYRVIITSDNKVAIERQKE